jgi:hypothetical protein
VTANDLMITDVNAGTGTFSIAVTFSEAMKTSVTPTLTFAPDVASTLSFNSRAWSAEGTIYTESYDVADAGVDLTGVKVGVTGAKDANGNAQEVYTAQAEFSIDTKNPTVTPIYLAAVENAPMLIPLVDDYFTDSSIVVSATLAGPIKYAWSSDPSLKLLIDPVSKKPVELGSLSGQVVWSTDHKSILITPDAKLDWMISEQKISATVDYTVWDSAGNSTTQNINLMLWGSTSDSGKTMVGTNGADKMPGTSAEDVLQGGNGTDVLTGLGGSDFLYGGNGNDTIDGGDGIDYLYGDSGNDVITGGAGHDVIFGGRNNDTLTGGTGNDHFVFMPKFGQDKVMDFNKVGSADLDTLHFIGIAPSGMTEAQFVSSYVTDTGKDLLITIGDNTITLVGVASIADLNGHISFVMPTP